MRTVISLLLVTIGTLQAEPFVPKGAFKVTATVMTSATGGARLANGKHNDADKRVFAALPARSALGRKVAIYSITTRTLITGIPVCDVGPHSTQDAYWERGARPLAEQGKSDKYPRATNKAGIDISLQLCIQLGLAYPYKGPVIWWFETEEA